MSRLAPRVMRSRISQLRRDRGLYPVPDDSVRELCGSPAASSLHTGPSRNRRAEESDAVAVRRTWFAHSLLLQPEARHAAGQVRTLPGCDGVLIYRCLSAGCFHRVPSLPYFPCSPSVTRFGAYPAPCGTSMFCFGCAALRVWVSKEKISLRLRPFGRDFFFGASQKAHLGTWERGTLPPHHTQIVCWGPRDLASLRARVSRG